MSAGRTRPRGGRHTRIIDQFAPRTIEMLRSQAYRQMSLSAHRLLSRIEIEFAQHGGRDNGKLPVTYDQFVEYGLHRHSISPAIRECVALGFLEITKVGRAGNAEFRAPNLFRLTYRHTDFAAATNEWKLVKNASLSKSSARKKARKTSGVTTQTEFDTSAVARPSA